MDLLVTVIIPTFNRKKSLLRAIDSVQNQTYQNLELLIVDDGSTDGTKKIVKEEYIDDERIHLFERPASRPKGANACRNIGIERAKGKYVALLDSDDEWEPEYLETRLNFVELKEKFSGLYSGATVKGEVFSIQKDSRDLRNNETHIDFLLNGGFAPTPSLFLNKKYAMDVKFDENLQRHQDWDFFIRFGKKYKWFFYDETSNVIINWGVKSKFKKISFDSCISFYETYKKDISSRNAENEYLFGLLQQAIVRDEKSASKYLKKILEKNNSRKGSFIYNFTQLYKAYFFLTRRFNIQEYVKLVLGRA